MSNVFETKGIILRRKALGEEDVLVTFLSPSLGLKKAIAPGAKKHKSPLRGKTELLLENNFLLIRGRSLDKNQGDRNGTVLSQTKRKHRQTGSQSVSSRGGVASGIERTVPGGVV
ncbi:MAG: recombination protein O N-terminal domain-containing protein [Geminocystis sp.]|nr:recombination protein O N-terminal domain-containing protein [Geminocystis sp.]